MFRLSLSLLQGLQWPGCSRTVSLHTRYQSLVPFVPFFSRRSRLREACMRSMTCTSSLVSPWSFCWRVMVVNSRRVSWAATTTCCQTATLIVASVWSSHSLLLACCWTVHPGDDRASVAMRAYVDLLSHTAARLLILPAVTRGWFTIPPKKVIPQPRTKSLASSFTASFRSSFTALEPPASTS